MSEPNLTVTDRAYDADTHHKAVRIVGQLEAMKEAAEHLTAMACDGGTQRLISAIRFLAQQAVLSAWEYAGQYAPPKGDAS